MNSRFIYSVLEYFIKRSMDLQMLVMEFAACKRTDGMGSAVSWVVQFDMFATACLN